MIFVLTLQIKPIHIYIFFEPQQVLVGQVPVWQIKTLMIQVMMIKNLILQPTFGMGGAKDPITMYRQQTLNGNTPPMRIYINRTKEEFSADMLTIYKKPNAGLRSILRVKFENEAAVGKGPVREFFSTLMGFLHDGRPQTSYPQCCPLQGWILYKCGRMIAHSFLHVGPQLYGLSLAVVEFWCQDSINAVTIGDVPDYELREALREVRKIMHLW